MMLDPVLVHQIFGALVLGFATAMLLRALKVIRGYWSEYLPASALVTLGALLAADPWIFHGGSFGSEGNQHVAQGLIALVAGGLEWFRVRRRSRNMLLLLVVPLVLSALGLAFLWHPQHAGGDMLAQIAQHRVMGVTLLFAALLKLIASFRHQGAEWAQSGWALVLIVFAFELLLYIERPGGENHAPADHPMKDHSPAQLPGDKQ